ncbi:MAG: hypothetical protein H7A25_12885 [Leptospiraceae bacterium]|nr:hypothetical protein [Leptospiraceae bacterium]MCP5500795.1 hypothetical protein [Leptospiraceae bacterium]
MKNPIFFILVFCFLSSPLTRIYSQDEAVEEKKNEIVTSKKADTNPEKETKKSEEKKKASNEPETFFEDEKPPIKKEEEKDKPSLKSESSEKKEQKSSEKPETKKEDKDPDALLEKYSSEEDISGSALSTITGEEFKPKFTIGGFVDFQALKAIPVKGSDDLLYKQFSDASIINEGLFYPMYPANASFRLANINLYTTFQVTDSWKFFTEFRLMTPINNRDQVNYGTVTPQGYNLTNGEPISGSGGYDGNGIRLGTQGGIFIERAYLEWNKYEALGLRIGKFFTPMGLWNQDHGAPILTSIRLPLTVTNPLSLAASPPLWNTGGEVFGKFFLGDEVVFDYIAFVGNGQCNDCDRVDDDRNKAFGAFGNFKISNILEDTDLDIGGSGYNGDRTIVDYYPYRNLRPAVDFNTVAATLEQQIAAAQQNSIIINTPTSGSFFYDRDKTSYFRKQNDVYGAGHIKLSMRNLPYEGIFVLQAEGWRQFTVNYPHYYDAGRTYSSPDPNVKNLRLIKPENYTVNTYYVQMEYQFFGKYTPYTRYDSLTDNMRTVNSGKYFEAETFGFNWKIDPKLVMKIETSLLKGRAVSGVGGAARLHAISLSAAF